MSQKKIYLTIRDPFGNKIYSDFIFRIDSVQSHTIIYLKDKYMASSIIRMPFSLTSITAVDGITIARYVNGVSVHITRK
jgi:hypothetical protein